MIDALSRTRSRLVMLLPPAVARELLSARVGRELALLDALSQDQRLSHEMVCRALLAFSGLAILPQADIRRALLESASDGDISDLADYALKFSNGIPASMTSARALVLGRSFQSGGSWARRICEVLELPVECAGQTGQDAAPNIQVVAPYMQLPPLHDYQLELREKLEHLLNAGRKRAMVALPTGAGKTRLLVDTLLEWDVVQRGRGSVVWVAQHAELCEQAIACIEQVWSARERPLNRPLKVQRVWAGKSEDIDWSADIIVGIPLSLGPRLMRDRKSAEARLAVTVIDEAHLATTTAYKEVFLVGSTAPLIGITATPARTADPSSVLRMAFGDCLIRSTILGSNPLAVLREKRILSRLEYEALDTGAVVTLSDIEREEYRKRHDYDPKFLERVGRNVKRNRAILDRLLRIPHQKPTLCFVSSVRSARALAAAMTINGRSAAVIDAETPPGIRRQLLGEFKSGAIQFLFNFEVLATGFDAPNVLYLLMGRPTRSLVLLEQMIGRGIRGPSNGGTEVCNVIWVRDDFENAENVKPLGYERFSKDWGH